MPKSEEEWVYIDVSHYNQQALCLRKRLIEIATRAYPGYLYPTRSSVIRGIS